MRGKIFSFYKMSCLIGSYTLLIVLDKYYNLQLFCKHSVFQHFSVSNPHRNNRQQKLYKSKLRILVRALTLPTLLKHINIIIFIYTQNNLNKYLVEQRYFSIFYSLVIFGFGFVYIQVYSSECVSLFRKQKRVKKSNLRKQIKRKL